jgi:hypothetical protein
MGYRHRWLDIRTAADRACCTPAKIHRAVRGGQLHARRSRDGELVFLESWIDEWLIGQVMPEDGEITVCIDATSSASRALSGVI